MILYFADRKFNILGQASTRLPDGILVKDDLKTEEIETGVAVFDGYVQYTAENRKQVETCAAVGNYILRKNGDECEFYTIIESEANTKNQEVYVYAEDAGLDLLNEVVGAYEADKAYPISAYVDKFAYDSGFEIGINEAASLSRKLSWDGESTVTERLESVATQFDCEISYSFDVKGLEITHKYINIYKKRGKDLGIQLRLNYDIDNIITKKSIANLATGLEVTGGTPEDAEAPITLKGYKYDDGDFFVSGTRLYSRKANQKWSRYIWNKEPNKLNDNSGYIVKTYSYDTTSQSELCSRAVTELKKLCDIEVNYEVEVAKLPDNVQIGDRVDIVDDAGELYASARVLKLESSAWNDKNEATLGEFLIKPAGISQKVLELAEQFAKTSLSAERANASDTLYAIWKANTYTVNYDANGGTGAPANQTKTYGVTLTLSSTEPTRTNYTFKGWGTSAASTTVAYAPGEDYTGNTAITLYAIWKLAYSEPIVTGLAADRCTASGTLAEDGQYVKVVFNWQIDAVNSGGLTSVVIQWKRPTDTEWDSVTAVSGGAATSGVVSKVVGDNALDTEYDYDIQIVVTDAKGNATYSIVLPAMKYIIDFLAGGNGVRIGGPASRIGFRDQFNTVFSNGCANVNFTAEDILDPDTTLESLIMTNVNTPNTGYMYIHTMFYEEKSVGANRAQCAIPYNSNGSMYHRYYYNGAWSTWKRHVNQDDTQELLWEGVLYMNATQSIKLPKSWLDFPNGIVLMWSAYEDGQAYDYQWNTNFLPKQQLDQNRGGYSFLLVGTNNWLGWKYLYFESDNVTINGNDNNSTSNISGAGATWNNNHFVLRRVYGV